MDNADLFPWTAAHMWREFRNYRTSSVCLQRSKTGRTKKAEVGGGKAQSRPTRNKKIDESRLY